MNRSVVLALSAIVLLGACGDPKPTKTAAVSSPELLPAQISPPAVEVSAVPLPPLPSATASDANAPFGAERPTPVETAAAPTAIDSAATDPKGTLSKVEEANSMPMAAQGNNHSSPSLESSKSSDSPPKQ